MTDFRILTSAERHKIICVLADLYTSPEPGEEDPITAWNERYDDFSSLSDFTLYQEYYKFLEKGRKNEAL